jgi:superfamily II DNA or RNA helicase
MDVSDLFQCSTPKALLLDRLYVDEAYVTEDMLKAYQTQYCYGEDPLSKEGLYKTINHYERIDIGFDKSLLAINRGDLTKLREQFKDFEIIDQRLSVPMKAPLKIRFPDGKVWRPYQPDAILAMTEREDGILESPPRSGKTLMLAAAVCMNREKTIVFAHQTDLLLQLLDTFEEFTNLKEIRTLQNPIVGFPTCWEDFSKLDVVLCTKQTFDNYVNRPRAEIVQKLFGAVLVDEVHFMGAEVYSKLINRFHARIKQGVTATPKRKDGLDIIVDGVLGNIFHRISAQTVGQLKLHVSIISTGIQLAKNIGYTGALKKLTESEPRNRLICDWMIRDVKDGHTIVAVTDRKELAYTLQSMLSAAGIASDFFNGDLTDRQMRKALLNRIRSREVRVLLSMRSMTTGLDIPAADCFYNLLPSANAVEDGEYEGGGGYEQQCTRVLTPYGDKKFGICRDFLDSAGVAYQCLRYRQKTYDKMGARIERHFNPDEAEKFKLDGGTAVDSVTF